MKNNYVKIKLSIIYYILKMDKIDLRFIDQLKQKQINKRLLLYILFNKGYGKSNLFETI